MKINPYFCKENPKNINKIKGAIRVKDKEGRIVCSVFEKHIYSPDGSVIAVYEKSEKDSSGKTSDIYKGAHGTFSLRKNKLYLGGDYIGKLCPDKKNKILIILIVIILVAAALLYLYKMKNANTLFLVQDKDGVWRASCEIDLFGKDAIAPGSCGEYAFTVINTSGGKLKYSIYIDCEYDSGDRLPPVEYTLENKKISFAFGKESEKYLLRDAFISRDGAVNLILKWEWPYESGKDGDDTYIGFTAGKYRCTITVEGTK